MKITDDMLTDEDLLRLWKKANGTHPDWGVFGHMVIDYGRIVLEEQRVKQSMQSQQFDASAQYDENDVHIGSGLPKSTCPCGLCQKMRGLKEKPHG